MYVFMSFMYLCIYIKGVFQQVKAEVATGGVL